MFEIYHIPRTHQRYKLHPNLRWRQKLFYDIDNGIWLLYSGFPEHEGQAMSWHPITAQYAWDYFTRHYIPAVLTDADDDWIPITGHPSIKNIHSLEGYLIYQSVQKARKSQRKDNEPVDNTSDNMGNDDASVRALEDKSIAKQRALARIEMLREEERRAGWVAAGGNPHTYPPPEKDRNQHELF